jgi:thiamine-phosphate diphosphorylase
MAELYAIAGTVERARFMLQAGVPYLQLRFKERPLAPHRDEIVSWLRRFSKTRLIINDDLAFAVEVGAWGAHLGQEDAMRYAPADLRRAPLKLGISTHDDGEIRRALELGAAMIGFGPVFATDTKALAHAPRGVARLSEVVRASPVPVIAIGGIAPENLTPVVETGVALIAMISALERFRSAEALAALMAALRGG